MSASIEASLFAQRASAERPTLPEIITRATKRLYQLFSASMRGNTTPVQDVVGLTVGPRDEKTPVPGNFLERTVGFGATYKLVESRSEVIINPHILNSVEGKIEELIDSGMAGSFNVALPMLFNGERAVFKAIRPDMWRKYPHLGPALLQEAAVLNALDHPHIVKILHPTPLIIKRSKEAGTDILGLVMEDIRGGSLVGQYIPPSEWIPLAEQAASALDYAHAQGVIHRDIKFGNIMRTERQKGAQTKIIDWSIDNTGTPPYCAPELFADDTSSVIGAADQHALAVCVYCSLNQQFGEIFVDTNAGGKSATHRLPSQKLAPLRQFVGLTDFERLELETVLQKATSYKPTDRYQSVTAFAEALKPYLLKLSLVEVPAQSTTVAQDSITPIPIVLTPPPEESTNK